MRGLHVRLVVCVKEAATCGVSGEILRIRLEKDEIWGQNRVFLVTIDPTISRIVGNEAKNGP